METQTTPSVVISIRPDEDLGPGGERSAWVEILRAKPVIRPIEWSELSGQPRSSVYRALKNGDLPSLTLGSAIFIPTAPLLELLGVTSHEEAS